MSSRFSCKGLLCLHIILYFLLINFDHCSVLSCPWTLAAATRHFGCPSKATATPAERTQKCIRMMAMRFPARVSSILASRGRPGQIGTSNYCMPSGCIQIVIKICFLFQSLPSSSRRWSYVLCLVYWLSRIKPCLAVSNWFCIHTDCCHTGIVVEVEIATIRVI